MSKFSVRNGLISPPVILTLNEISSDLRTSLWNLLNNFIQPNSNKGNWVQLSRFLCSKIFKVSVTTLPFAEYSCNTIIESLFTKADWYKIFELIEVLYPQLKLYGADNIIFTSELNSILKEEYSGYTFVDGKFIALTDKTEIESIKESVNILTKIGYGNLSIHFEKALQFMSKRPEPDYHNSIKESISALEGLCKVLTGEKSGGLKDALEKLSAKVYIHKAMKESFLKLYGYTSDQGGIRHPMLEEDNVGFDEAKYMLVTCSTFVNFLISKSLTAKLL